MNTLEKYLEKIKNVKHHSEEEFDATEFSLNLLRRIEFSNAGNEKEIISARTEMIIPYRSQEPKHLYFLAKNSIRFFTTAIDMMVVKAQLVSEDQGRPLELPLRDMRIFYQKKLTRVMQRVVKGEGVYKNYVLEEKENGEEPDAMVSIELHGSILSPVSFNTNSLVFSGITRGFIRNPAQKVFQHDKNLENLF